MKIRVALLASLLLGGCAAEHSFPALPEEEGIVKEITLSDGTRCVLHTDNNITDFTCDWEE